LRFNFSESYPISAAVQNLLHCAFPCPHEHADPHQSFDEKKQKSGDAEALEPEFEFRNFVARSFHKVVLSVRG
jgi:hypothetical protein